MNLSQLSGKKIGLCVSGGLDSKTLAKRLTEAGVDVVCFTADIAQPDEKDIQGVVAKMAPCGVDTIIVDLKELMAKACFLSIKSQAMYDGGYWNTTGLARAVTVAGIVPEMQKRGISILSHGATGRGNDQMRFERYTQVLAPTMQVYAPWRDPELLSQFPGRTQMADYLQSFGIPAVVGMKKKYSTDANLAGLSHEAEDLESLETPCTIVEPIMGVWPQEAPDKIESVSVRFVKGEVVTINGEVVSPLQAMTLANSLAGRNGIWMKNALENRIIGTKSRGVYEAPGMELLAFCLRQLYQVVHDKRSAILFSHLSSLVSAHIYEGRLFDPSSQAAIAAINHLAVPASGVVQVGLYKGNMYFQSLTECSTSLYNEKDSSMEESDGLNPVSSQGFAEIQGVEALALANAGQIAREGFFG